MAVTYTGTIRQTNNLLWSHETVLGDGSGGDARMILPINKAIVLNEFIISGYMDASGGGGQIGHFLEVPQFSISILLYAGNSVGDVINGYEYHMNGTDWFYNRQFHIPVDLYELPGVQLVTVFKNAACHFFQDLVGTKLSRDMREMRRQLGSPEQARRRIQVKGGSKVLVKSF